MKIAILVLLFPPKWLAGTEIATHNIASHLAQRGHEVHVITSRDRGLPTESSEQGFQIHRVGFPRVRVFGLMAFCMAAVLKVRRLNPDIVHQQDVKLGAVGFMAKKLLRRPWVVWGQGSDVYLPWTFKRPISKLVLKNADAVIALTADMKAEMCKICSRGIDVIPNGVDLERYEALPSKVAIRAELGLDDDDRIAVFVGTLRPVKGVKYLIEAMSIIKHRCATARLLLVGDGEERQSIEGMVKELNLEDTVTFLGRMSNDKVPKHMAASDVFVLPSLSEGFPVTVLEAMATGLPVVASRVRGLPEIIEDGRNGFLVEPKRPDQIADRVLVLLADSGLRQEVAAINREKARQYSWENTVEQVEAVYRRALKDDDMKGVTC